MILVGILIIAAIIGFIIPVIDSMNDWVEKIGFGIAYSVFWVVIAGIISAFIQLGAVFIFDTEYVKYNEEEIVSLGNTHETVGSFFLGSGTIEGVQTYYYMIEDEKGKNVKSVDASKSYVTEDNGIEPYIEYRHKQFKNKLLNKILFYGWSEEYIINIPEGSILQEFNISL